MRHLPFIKTSRTNPRLYSAEGHWWGTFFSQKQPGLISGCIALKEVPFCCWVGEYLPEQKKKNTNFDLERMDFYLAGVISKMEHWEKKGFKKFHPSIHPAQTSFKGTGLVVYFNNYFWEVPKIWESHVIGSLTYFCRWEGERKSHRPTQPSALTAFSSHKR